jgi:hypothetical protein
MDHLENDMDGIRKGLADIDRHFTDSTLLIYRPTEDQERFLNGVLIHYMETTPEQRAAVLEAFRGRYGLLNMLVGLAYTAADRIRSTGEDIWLRIGLTAASIEESLGKVDFRDRLLALAELFVTAEEAGLDPRADFESICGLKGFSDYAVVRSRRQKT